MGELRTQVIGQPADDTNAPALAVLPDQDLLANAPVQGNQFRVDPALGREPCLAYLVLQRGQRVNCMSM
jgi:hypothetical protein